MISASWQVAKAAAIRLLSPCLVYWQPLGVPVADGLV